MKSPPAKPRDPDATGELFELSADDILESDDIDALEAAAAGFDENAFESGGAFEAAEEVAAEADPFAPESPQHFDSEPVAPAAKPVVVTQPSPQYVVPAAVAQAAPVAPAAALADTVPADMESPVAARNIKTTMGMPPAPTTSPLPLEESVIIAEDAPLQEKTLELRGNVLAQVAAAAAAMDANAPEATEVIHRSSLPSNIRTAMGGMQAAPHHAGKPSSIAPVALDVTPRAAMASVPAIPVMRAPANVHPMPVRAAATAAPPKPSMNHIVIGGLVFAAVALIGLVGLGGYAATRALSDKPEGAAVAASEGEPTSTTSTSPSPSPAQDNNNGGVVTAPASGPFPLPPSNVVAPPSAPSDPNGASASAPAFDVSTLPSAPAPGSRAPASHGITSGVTGAPLSPPAAAPITASGPVARGGSGGNALPPPGAATPAAKTPAGGATLLPPPGSAPASAPASGGGGGTGVIHVDPKLRAVEVDGSWFRASDGNVVVSCGSHRVKAGMNGVQSVNVPCGGAVTL